MSVAKSLSNTMRSALVAAALGAATAAVLAAVVLPGWAQNARNRSRRHIDRQFHLHAADADGEGRHHRHLDQQGRHPARHRRGRTTRFAKSKALDTDDSYSFTFTTPGTYQYFCYIHPHMTGTIVVEPRAANNAARRCSIGCRAKRRR